MEQNIDYINTRRKCQWKWSIYNRSRKDFYWGQTEDYSQEDSFSDNYERLLWRCMDFSLALYLVRRKNIKQVQDTFLQGFNKKPDYHIHSVSVWLWQLRRESYQRWTNIASQEGRQLVFIFDMDILYFWSLCLFFNN